MGSFGPSRSPRIEVGLVCVRPDDERQRRAAETLYEALRKKALTFCSTTGTNGRA